ELLKTTDLENITFSQFQGVAEKIFAEQGAEDELRRIVLVNLARLSVVGEWTGLTSAGGGDPVYATAPVENFTGAAGALTYQVPAEAYGPRNVNNGIQAGMYCIPFVASDDGDVDAFQINAQNTSGTTTKVGIYNTTTEGLPDTLQVSADITTSATGPLTQTSLTGSLTMVKGTTYWLAWIADTSLQTYACIRYNTIQPLSPLPATVVTAFDVETLLYDATPTSLPATFTPSDFDAVIDDMPKIGVRLA
ncbi:MAG: hypothetical protein GWO38_30630, partial [Phycisphaerae bacterium]|nr:hypothetical protein [Phycisphaerae bacterium]NIX02637.1 hypothetical protein [Phycisphaerae bacterium]NIX31864.1 hypothetical protein [Phycisphaerae bacterium]